LQHNSETAHAGAATGNQMDVGCGVGRQDGRPPSPAYGKGFIGSGHSICLA
jgi:hypothetical protein